MLTFAFQFRRLFAVFAVCSLSICLGPPAARADVDDFNDGTDDGWTHYNPLNTGSWSLPNGAYRLQSAASPSTTYGPGRVGSFRTVETYSAFYVAVDIVAWDNTLDELFGLTARVTTPGLGTTKAYGFTYTTRTGRTPAGGQLEILRILNESGTDITTESNFTFQVGSQYRMIFTGAQAQLRGEVYLLPNLTTPVAVLTANDGTYTSGQVGIFTYDSSPTKNHTADTTFDNFEFKELPPTLTIEKDTISTDLKLSWPVWATGYSLERAGNLPVEEGDWENLGNSFPNDGFNYFAFDDPTLNNQAFYRLRK